MSQPRSSIEREVKLTVSPDFELPDLRDAAKGIEVVPLGEQTLRTVYYDTADLRLTRWRVALRCRLGETEGADARWTIKLPDDDDGSETRSRREIEIDAPPDRVPEPLEHLVRAYVRGSPLVPIAVLHARRRRTEIRVGTPPEKALEIDDDVVVVEGEDRRTFREIEVELAPAGDEKVLSKIVDRLVAVGAEPSEGASKLTQALGEVALAPPEVVVPELDRRATLGEVARAALAAGVERLLRHDPGVRLGDDPEDVHQARVATRRLRSDLRTFADALDAKFVEAARDELRWLGGALGNVRDADVLFERLSTHAGELPAQDARSAETVLKRLSTERAVAREELVADLDSDRYIELVDHLVQAARHTPLGPEAQASAVDTLPKAVDRQWRKLRKAHDVLGPHPDDGALHQLRIRAKRVRYAAEATVPVCGKSAARFAKAIAGLQGVLGDLHDAVVAEEWLRVSSSKGPARPAFAAGELAARERQEQQAARRAWRDEWHDVIAARKRWLS